MFVTLEMPAAIKPAANIAYLMFLVAASLLLTLTLRLAFGIDLRAALLLGVVAALQLDRLEGYFRRRMKVLKS